MYIFPQLKVVGLLNSTHESVRPLLLDFLFSDHPLRAAIIIIVVVIEGSHPLTNSNCPYCSEDRFHDTTTFFVKSRTLRFWSKTRCGGVSMVSFLQLQTRIKHNIWFLTIIKHDLHFLRVLTFFNGCHT